MGVVVQWLDAFSSLLGAASFHINPIQGPVIAVLSGLMAAGIAGVVIVPVIGVIVYVGLDTVLPTLLHHKPIAVPALDAAFWHEALVLYVGFLIVTVVIFLIRKAITGFRN